MRNQRVVGVAEQPIDRLPLHVGLERARHGIDGADQRVTEVDRFLRGREVLRHRVHQATAEAERLEPPPCGETPGDLPKRPEASHNAMAPSSVSAMMTSRNKPVPCPRGFPDTSA